MALRRFLAERFLFFFASFAVLVALNFLIPRLMPGNPVTRFINPLMSPQVQQQILEEFGLTKPLYVQFVLYLQGIFTGHYGVSFLYYPTPVADVILQRLPWTIFLVGSATLLSILLGIFLGLLSASKAGSKSDSLLVLASMALRSIPTFWLSLLLLIVFGVMLRIFPTTGYFSTELKITGAGLLEFISSVLSHSFLPIVALMAYLVGGNLLLMRASALGTLGEDFVLTLHAIGYPRRTILYSHVLKNAFLPMLTNIGIQMGYIASGAVLVETVFSYPGMGLLIYQAVLARDYPTLQGSFFILTAMVLMAVLITDLLYSVLDPRVRR
jgi:peptide/nickel transport system permease protein